MQILFITANRLGDAVLSTGLLAALLQRYPDAALTIACGPLPASLFTAIPNATVIVLEKQPYAGHWWDLWLAAIGKHWDLIVDLRGSLVSRLLLSKRCKVWRKPAGRPHKVEELATLLDEATPTAPRLWHTPESLEQAKALLPEGPILAIAPGANSVGKRWPTSRFIDLAQILTAKNGILPDAAILFVGDQQDRALIEPHLFRLPPDRIVNLAGEIPLATTAACLSLAGFYVGNDSGLTHLAAAAGVPTLALFGPGIAWKYRPWGDKAAYVSKADDPDRTYDLCKDGNDAAALALMEQLLVHDAVAAAGALWQKVQP